MKASKILSLAVLSSGIALMSFEGSARAEAPYAWGAWLSDRYDQIYWARPHNTYQTDHFGHLDYALWDGFRALELDVHEYSYVDGVPQFPVKHDVWNGNTSNNCKWGAGGYLRDCLFDIKNWSDANPGHLPITVQIDLKSISATNWNPDQYDELHDQIGQVLGSKLYRPEDLRSWTGQDSLRLGVAMYGWPALGALTDKIIVLIMGGPIGDKNDQQENYVRRWHAYANAFVCPNADQPAHFNWYGSADDFDEYDTNKWVICGNVGSPDGWSAIAANADANHQLMNLWRSGWEYDDYDQMYLAVGWGASMISRGSGETWGGRVPLVGVRRSVPVEFKMVNESSGKCVDVWNGSYANGTDILQWSCNGDPNQTWIYTDQGQLLSKGNTSYCYDIEGGDGDLGDRHHIWQCDGGASEKWRLHWDGSFVGKNDRCIDVPYSSTADGTQLWHYDCNGTTAQRFYLYR